MTSKHCSNCKHDLPLSQFFQRSNRPGKLRSWCKDCTREQSNRDGRKYRRATEQKYATSDKGRLARRKHLLQVRFGISLEEFEEMASIQNGRCAICNNPETAVTRHGRPKPLFVDHDHTTGQVRQLLCSRCNSMIGMANENVATLKAAIDYLQRHAAVEPVAIKLQSHTTDRGGVGHIVGTG